MPRLTAVVPFLGTFVMLGGMALRAQCANAWVPGPGLPGVSGVVQAMTMWDPDGAGPATARLMVGGSFEFAGATAAKYIAAWDPANGAWAPLGSDLSGQVFSFATLSDGSLAVGGGFTQAGGAYANYIARWDGAAWSPFGYGMFGGPVIELVTLANGDLVAGGAFSAADGFPVNGIARWNGTAWSALGTGLGGSFPFATGIVVLANGDLLVGGRFTSAGGVPAANLARWNGSSWSAVGTGTNDSVTSLRQLANGDLLVTGRFTSIDGVAANRVARWNGSTFTPLGSGLDNEVARSIELPNGDLVVSGRFQTAGGVAARCHARWDGVGWSPLGSGIVGIPLFPAIAVPLVLLPSGEVAAGGSFQQAGGSVATNIARWNGASWSPMNPGFFVSSAIGELTKMSTGAIVVGGNFTTIGGIAADNIARWDGTAWSALGTGFGGANPAVSVVAELPNGDLVAGGTFTTAGTTAVNCIARWDGAAWSALGTGVTGPGAPFFLPAVSAVVVLPNGELVVGGSFQSAGGVSASNLARWDGATWSPFAGGTNGSVSALVVLPGGDLLAAGAFTQAGGTAANRIARWNGTTWTPLGAGTNNAIGALAVRADGSVFAGGTFTTAGGAPANRVARWGGTAWSALGSGLTHSAANLNPAVTRLVLLPNGDLVAGGSFNRAGGASANRIARWNGATWSSFGAGCDDAVFDMLLDGAELVIGGGFRSVGGQVASCLARLSTTCPPAAAPTGSGCNGATLAATTLPWVGAPFRATGRGLPPLAFVVALTSTATVAPPLPLSAASPLALPGCDLLVAPDLQQVLVTTSGVATSELLLANTPPLVGLTFHHQMVSIAVDAQLNLLSITATNALQLTAGAF